MVSRIHRSGVHNVSTIHIQSLPIDIDTAFLFTALPSKGDFEHRLVFASVRFRLFLLLLAARASSTRNILYGFAHPFSIRQWGCGEARERYPMSFRARGHPQAS
ncbi:hypothetical protein MRX96_032864 [Rhipicephalus microplus]